MAKVLNGVEKLRKISTGWVTCTNVTDRQTDDTRTGDSIANVATLSPSILYRINRIERRLKTAPRRTQHVVVMTSSSSRGRIVRQIQILLPVCSDLYLAMVQRLEQRHPVDVARRLASCTSQIHIYTDLYLQPYKAR